MNKNNLYATKVAIPLTKPLPKAELTALAGSQVLDPIPVLLAPEGTHNHCYWNVRAKVKACGGEEIQGWKCDIRGPDFYEYTHHSIWKRPDGVLRDITSPAIGFKGKRITFAPTFGLVVMPNNIPPTIENYFSSPSPHLPYLRAAHKEMIGARKAIAKLWMDRGVVYDVSTGVPLEGEEIKLHIKLREYESIQDLQMSLCCDG